MSSTNKVTDKFGEGRGGAKKLAARAGISRGRALKIIGGALPKNDRERQKIEQALA